MEKLTIEEVENDFKQLFISNNHERNCKKQDTFNNLLLQLKRYFIYFEYKYLLNLGISAIPNDVEDRAKIIDKTTKKISQYIRKATKSGFLIKQQFSKENIFFEVLYGETTEILVPLANIKEILEVSGLISKPEKYNYFLPELVFYNFRCLFA